MDAPSKADSTEAVAGSGKRSVGRAIVLLPALLLFPLHVTAVGPEPEPDAADVYIDQLIDPATIEEDIDPVYRELSEQPPGRRYLGTRLYHFSDQREGQGFSHENGVQVDWRRETYNYGELEVTGALLDVTADRERSDKPSTGSLLTVRQHDFAVNNEWLMQNSLGIDRTWYDSRLANSYRFKLPSTLTSGVNTMLSSSAGDFRFGAGRLGHYDIAQVQTYDATDGSLVGAGYSTRLSDELESAVQIVNVNGADTVADHQSCAGVLEYRPVSGTNRFQGHILADSEGAAGIWLDGDAHTGRVRQRFGVFRLEPDLLWTDTAMANDQQGAYLRTDLKTLRYQLSGGIDFNRTGLDSDSLLNGIRNTNAFVTANRQLTRLSSIGGVLNLRDTRSSDDAVLGDARDISLTLHGSHRLRAGTTRLQLQLADIVNGVHHGHGSGITWDQSWEVNRSFLLSGTLGYEVEHGTGNDERRTTVGLLAYHDYSSNLRWDSSVNWTRTENDSTLVDTDSLNASLAMLWRFLPGWEAALRASVNDAREDATSGLAGTEYEGTERTLFLSVRRDITSGRPFERYGRATGKTGYGDVQGVVFFDDNRDGIRQAGETVAAGVYVYLDRRYQKVTDRDGRFEFKPVPAGQHALSIALEDLPLPWGLDDEAPRLLEVKVRASTDIAIPLVRFDE